MARKPRDYKAEERRRNELARQRGYTSRAAQRHKIETGRIAPLMPNRIRSPFTIAAQKVRDVVLSRNVPVSPNHPEFDRAVAGVSVEQRASDWASIFARTHVTTFEDALDKSVPNVRGRRKRKDTKEERATLRAKHKFISRQGRKAYVDAYMAAFVEGPERYAVARREGSHALYYWLVIVTEYMTAEEYDSKYTSDPT